MIIPIHHQPLPLGAGGISGLSPRYSLEPGLDPVMNSLPAPPSSSILLTNSQKSQILTTLVAAGKGSPGLDRSPPTAHLSFLEVPTFLTPAQVSTRESPIPALTLLRAPRRKAPRRAGLQGFSK